MYLNRVSTHKGILEVVLNCCQPSKDVTVVAQPDTEMPDPVAPGLAPCSSAAILLLFTRQYLLRPLVPGASS